MSDIERDKLVKAMAKLEAARQGAKKHEADLIGRADEQLGSMGQPLDVAAQHVDEGKGGGIMGFRYLRTLQQERQRLESIVNKRKWIPQNQKN